MTLRTPGPEVADVTGEIVFMEDPPDYPSEPGIAEILERGYIVCVK